VGPRWWFHGGLPYVSAHLSTGIGANAAYSYIGTGTDRYNKTVSGTTTQFLYDEGSVDEEMQGTTVTEIHWHGSSSRLSVRLTSGRWRSVILCTHTEDDQEALLQMIVSHCDLSPTRRPRRALAAGATPVQAALFVSLGRNMRYSRRTVGRHLPELKPGNQEW
jgi:hypothetical protein